MSTADTAKAKGVAMTLIERLSVLAAKMDTGPAWADPSIVREAAAALERYAHWTPDDSIEGWLDDVQHRLERAEKALEEAQRANESAEMTGRIKAINLASFLIEQRVEQLDQWAKESADKGEYSGAASNQKAAVDLHCAAEILKGPHNCRHPGFRYDLGDRCDRCAYDAAMKGDA